jgi:hypothetical protein
MVDFFMINVVVQGLNLGKLIRRKLIAPKKLTQFEMNEAYSVKVSSHSKYGSRTTHISHSKYGSRTTHIHGIHIVRRGRGLCLLWPILLALKADLYVVDRLQILTKFAVLALMYSAALPVLHHPSCLTTLTLTPTLAPTLTLALTLSPGALPHRASRDAPRQLHRPLQPAARLRGATPLRR